MGYVMGMLVNVSSIVSSQDQQSSSRRDDWYEVLFKVPASGQCGQSAGSRVSEMKLAGCFDVLFFRATGNTEMIKCVFTRVQVCVCVWIDWWLGHQQCADCFVLDFHHTKLALNSLRCGLWISGEFIYTTFHWFEKLEEIYMVWWDLTCY